VTRFKVHVSRFAVDVLPAVISALQNEVDASGASIENPKRGSLLNSNPAWLLLYVKKELAKAESKLKK
jgi:hypothetical protein